MGELKYGRTLGLDLSLCSTGVAQLYSHGGPAELHTAVIKSSGKRSDTLADRAARVRDLRDRIVSWITPFTSLVVIESPSLGSKGAGTWDRAGLWWAVVSWLAAHEVPTATISPLSLKRFASGSGKADKAAMLDAFEALWGERPKTDDQADAGHLALAGAVHLGLEGLPDLSNQKLDSLDKAAWPEGK